MQAQTLGAAIRAGREAQGLTQKQLAELLDVAKSQVLRWERDEYLPKAAALLQLAEQLELPSHRLLQLAGITATVEVNPTIPAMLRSDYDLPPEAVAEIEAHIAEVAARYRQSAASKNTKSHSERRET